MRVIPVSHSVCAARRAVRRAMQVAVACVLFAGAPARVAAQQIDVVGSYIPGDGASHYPLVGGGLGVRQMVDAGAVFLGLRLGAAYAREEHLGPGRGTVGVDLTLVPHTELRAVVPYAGVGLSLNWSGGSTPAWSGLRRGVDGIAGVDLAIFHTDLLGLKLEGRYGAIESLAREVTMRAGLVAGF